MEQQCFVHTFLSVWEDQKCTTRLLHSFSNCTFLWHSFLPIFYDDAVSTKRNAVYYMRLFSKWGAPLLLLLPHWSISWVLLYEIEQKNPRLTYLEKANETYFRPLFKENGLSKWILAWKFIYFICQYLQLWDDLSLCSHIQVPFKGKSCVRTIP